MNLPNIRLTYSALALSTALAAAPAFADDAAYEDPDTIIVTGSTLDYGTESTTSATKTDAPLIDVPQTISIVTREQIDDQALQNIGDILRYTPGASTGQGEGHRDQITIRGQNTTADFFVDGLRDDVQYFRPLYNLERVEILKGSNALIFGRGGGGGVINRVTKTPSAVETFGSVSGGGDSFGAFAINGDVNVKVGDAAAFRINAFVESFNNHRDFFGGERFGFNPTFAANLDENTRFLASYEYLNDDRTVDRGIPSENGAPIRGFRDTFFGDPQANITTFEAHIVKLRLEHDFSDSLSANLTTQYGNYDKLYQNLFAVGFNSAANTVTLDGYRDTTERDNFITQGNLVWKGNTGPLKHTLLLGFEYGEQNTANARRNVLFAASNDDRVTFGFTDPLATPAFTFPAVTRDRASDASFLSFYAQDQIEIGNLFQIVGGVRYDRFEINVVDAIEVNDGTADGNDGLPGRVDTKYSPRVGLIFKPLENISIYTSYALSFLPRSGDQFLTLSPTNENLAPEEFENIEAGIKWDIRPDLSLTASVFRLDRDNLLQVVNNNGDSETGGSRTRGFEVQLVGNIMSNWQINAGYSYLDGNERGRVNGAGNFANRRSFQVPRHMISLWNRYDVTGKFGLGLGVTHQSSQFARIDNAVRIPSFTRV